MSLQWADVTGESGYRLERSGDGVSGWSPVAELAENTTAQLDTGLSANTTYYYRVIATTEGGDASISDVVSATTLIDPADPPVVVAVAVSATQIDLSWTDVGTETGYRIERSTDGVTWSPIGSAGQDVTSYVDTGLAAGTAYSYRVIATNAAGDSAPSEVVTATTATDATVPSDPPTDTPAG